MIHKTSIIDKKAKISSSAKIGPYTIIGPEVEIGENVNIYSHVNIAGHTKIGSGTTIFPFSSIGTQPQDLKYKGEKNKLIIGKNNIIREYVTINPGTEGGGGLTSIGNECLFMISSHIAHDCKIGNNVVIANNVPIGGHAVIEDSVTIGGNSAVQQFTRIGRLAMIGGMTGVLNDVIPFGLSFGNRNYLNGINLVGLRRAKISNENIKIMQKAYDIIFKSENFRLNIDNLNSEIKNNVFVNKIVKFINSDKKRPISLPENIK